MLASWLFLAIGVGAYGCAHFYQSWAARTHHEAREGAHGSFFRRLASERLYWFGLVAQVIGAGAAIGARAQLPLFLVQAALTAGIAVTAFLGVVVLGWRLPWSEVALLAAMASGLAMLVASARGSSSHALGRGAIAVLALLPIALVIAARAASRLHGVPGSVLLGALSGFGYSAAAVASRPVASLGDLSEILESPLLYIMALNGLVAQVTLAQAFRAGSPTAAIAALDAAGAIPSAMVGIVLLGDSVRSGFAPVATIGFMVTIGAVIALARYASPQGHPEPESSDASDEGVLLAESSA